MSIQSIFFGDNGLFRSGWRFAIFMAIFVPGVALFGSLAIGILYSAAGAGHSDPSTFLITNGLVSLAVALVAGWICGRYLERLPFSALGVSFRDQWFLSLIAGLVLGAITLALAAGIGNVAGGLSFSMNAAATSGDIGWTLSISFLVFAAAAAFEEALFRGYILQTFVRSDLKLLGAVLTSLLFATVHMGNPAVSTIGWLNTFIAGLWFAVAYLKARDLWLPFGLHLAWNWTQGSVFGVEVSGLTDIVRAPMMRESEIGPAWLTGGDYGIEGGIVTTAAIIISIIFIYFLPLRKYRAE
jgi:uncharacterized protein